jgi:plastocyanin
MRRTIAKLFGLAATSSLILWLFAAPATSAGDPCYHGFSMPTTTSEATTEIKLMPCAFAPTIARVPVGATVTFVNGPDFAHLVTGANQAWGSRDAELQPGAKVSYAFATAGVYPYACALHRGMSGAIIVGDGAAAAGSAIGATSGSGAAGAGTTAGGTTTGTTAGGDTTGDPTAASSLEGPALLALIAGAGIIVGAGAVALAGRRRHTDEEPTRQQAV